MLANRRQRARRDVLRARKRNENYACRRARSARKPSRSRRQAGRPLRGAVQFWAPVGRPCRHRRARDLSRASDGAQRPTSHRETPRWHQAMAVVAAADNDGCHHGSRPDCGEAVCALGCIGSSAALESSAAVDMNRGKAGNAIGATRALCSIDVEPSSPPPRMI